MGPWGYLSSLHHVSKNLCVWHLKWKCWHSHGSPGCPSPVSLKLDDDAVVSVEFLAWTDLSSSAIVSCLAGIVQEA